MWPSGHYPNVGPTGLFPALALLGHPQVWHMAYLNRFGVGMNIYKFALFYLVPIGKCRTHTLGPSLKSPHMLTAHPTTRRQMSFVQTRTIFISLRYLSPRTLPLREP